MIKKIVLTVFVLTGLLCRTDSPPTVFDNGGGNTSETTNGVTLTRSGEAVRGRTLPFAFVGMYSSDFVGPNGWGTKDSTEADSTGAFLFDSLSEGTYNLIAWDSGTDSALLCRDIMIASDSVFISERGTFAPTGSLLGVLRDKDSTVFPFSFCFLVGTPFHTVSDSQGLIRYESLPAGTYTIGIPTLMNTEQLGSPGTYERKNIQIASDSITKW